jgi:hypothetical protein
MSAADNSQKTDAQLAWDFVADEFRRQEMTPQRILQRLTGDEPPRMGCPRVN